MKKAYAFYLSDNDGPGRQEILLPDGSRAWVRVEAHHGLDCLEALDAAKPKRDEWLMNTCDMPLFSLLPSRRQQP